MITDLHICNFTIITDVALCFDGGMTVVTGETGAGKSIIIDALELAMGGRTDSKLVRQGAKQCDIHVTFNLTHMPDAAAWLSDNDLADEEGECLLRRTVTSEGRSRCYINGQPVTLQKLKSFSAQLVHIHGQHQPQLLLKRDAQRDALDRYANASTLCEEVNQCYHQYQQTQQTLTDLQTKSQERDARLELLHYQIEELDQLALQEGELEKLHREHKQLANVEDLKHNSLAALEVLSSEAAEGTDILQLVHKAEHLLASVQHLDPHLDNACNLVRQASIQTVEAANELRCYLDGLDNDPQRLQTVEKRLQAIHDLARKHRVQPEMLFSTWQTLKTEYQQLKDSDTHLENLHQSLQQLQEQYKILSNKLTQARHKAAKKLNKSITEHMHQLSMPSGAFEISLTPVEAGTPTLHGQEQVNFCVRTNAGQPMQPLAKVVSGGELSRISLSLHLMIAQHLPNTTLIFDEVDVGIGGATAEIVGGLLKKLGQSAQVLCVTHLPQVASQGDHHLRVEKHDDSEKTFTDVKTLSHAERVEEIARMLGGLKITKATRDSAEEMLAV